MERNIEACRKVWPEWTSNDPFDLENIDLPPANEDGSLNPEFELADCFHDDSYVPKGKKEPVIQFKANWFNPIGGSQNMPAKMDDASRKKVLATWGGRFKASGGAKPAAAPKPAAAAPAKSAAKPAGPPGRSNASSAQARTMTQEEVWDGLVSANPNEGEDALGKRFWDVQDKLFPGKNGELSIQQWGKVAEELGL